MIEKGISEKKLSKVHSPIGLSINALTPQEIAVSIMAEIISIYRKEKNACIVSPSLIKTLASERNCVICRVLKASGSTPAREGQILIVNSQNITSGTIGGGALEEEAKKEASLCTGSYIKTYNLSKDGELGMTCGGEVTVLFDPSETLDCLLDVGIDKAFTAFEAVAFLCHLITQYRSLKC